MKRFINFLLFISSVINYIATILQDMNLHQEYYVYVPTRSKPVYKHRLYKNAEQEAFRIAKQCKDYQEIEVLHVVKRIWGEEPDIPF